MHKQVQSVPLDPRRTAWTRDGLRIGLRGDRQDHYQPIGRSLPRGVLDVLVDDLPLRVDPEVPLPTPLLLAGRLVNPIARTPDDRLALDVDEVDRPITRRWRPRPEDLRCAPWFGRGRAGRGRAGRGGAGREEPIMSAAEGIRISLDLELAGAGAGERVDEDNALAVELLLERAGERLALPAELVPGPGTVGRLRADLPNDALRPGESWTLLLRTAHRTGLLGLDLSISAAGLPFARPSVAATVVVPVGAESSQVVADCIGSALEAALPDEPHEVLAVDRGCGTGTAGLLDWMATLHRSLRVLHLGPCASDAARSRAAPAELAVRRGITDAYGEFVFFLRPGDRLAPNALADLLGYARTHHADVVLARSADANSSDGGPRPPFRRSLPYATLAGADLVRSLTPATLFRTCLLERHGLSFGPPGPDQQRFVAEAYLLAERVAVFSQRVCYRRGPSDPEPTSAAGHATQLAGALTALQRHVPAGSGAYTRLLRHWYRTEILGRLRGDALLALPPAERPAWVHELTKLASEHADPVLARGLPPADQLVAALLARGGNEVLPALLALAEWERTIDVEAEVRWLRPDRDVMAISAQVRLSGHGAPVFRSDGDRVSLDPPLAVTQLCAELSTDGWSGTAQPVPDPRSVRRHLDAARIELVATVDGQGEQIVTAHNRSVRFDDSEFRVWADLPTRAVPGRRLRLGVRLRCCGWLRTAPLVARAGVLARQRRVHPPLPHTGSGPVAVDVPEHGGRPMAILADRPPRAGAATSVRTMLRVLGSE